LWPRSDRLDIGAAKHELERITGQGTLQRHGFNPRGAKPSVALLLVVRLTGIALK
jgi:hypothetical protein